jgi:hypothetical protein
MEGLDVSLVDMEVEMGKCQDMVVEVESRLDMVG